MRYEEILRALDGAGVRHVIVGGIAVILHGVPRTTADLDLLLDLEPANVARFLDAVHALGFRPRAPVPARDLGDAERRAEWVREKGLKAFTLWRAGQGGGEIDVLLDAPLDYAEASRDAVALEADGIPLRIASIDALIRMKRAAAREQDLSDIEALRKVERLSAEPGEATS